MTREEINNKITEAEFASKFMGLAWLMSNGEKITVTWQKSEKEFNSRHGFWVAKIFEDGRPVEA